MTDALAEDRLAVLDGRSLDVLVVGGGVTGAATLRHLALEGLAVALVEKGSFGSGASGASTRIAQGGFRYLETGGLALVRRSVRERDRLIRNAGPDAVRPIRVVIPTRHRFAGLPAAIARFLRLRHDRALPGYLVLGLAARLYDRLSGGSRILPAGGTLSAGALRRRHPGIHPGYGGGAYVYEGAMADPLALLRGLVADGRAGGALAFDGVEVTGRRNGAVRLRDTRTDRVAHVHARVVVNAAGAWSDRVSERLGLSLRLVGGVGGTHLLLDHPRLAEALAGDLLFFEHPGDRRLCCAYDVGGRVLLGATETPVDDPDAAGPTPADEDYLLAAIRHLFPAIDVGPADVVGRTHGVRPLLRSTTADPNRRSREHLVRTDVAPGGPVVVTVAGGKWTTFRLMAEEATDAVLAALCRTRRIDTTDRPIRALPPP